MVILLWQKEKNYNIIRCNISKLKILCINLVWTNIITKYLWFAMLYTYEKLQQKNYDLNSILETIIFRLESLVQIMSKMCCPQGVEQWEAWSCDLRANERPQKKKLQQKTVTELFLSLLSKDWSQRHDLYFMNRFVRGLANLN